MTAKTPVQPIRLGLIRHGETSWNREKKIQGVTETHLTAAGRAQALAWGAQLAQFPWHRILTSDLARAQETAHLINRTLQLTLHQDSGLREQDWGRWTSTTIRQLRDTQPEAVAAREAAGWDFCPPDGESRRAVLQRGRKALLKAADRWPNNQILVVTHAGVLKCLLYDLAGRSFLPSEPPLIRPYHLHRLQTTTSGLAIEHINALAL